MKNNLAEVRQKLGMTQQDVSMASGFTQGQICRWENGAGFSIITALKLAKALGVAIEEIIEEPVYLQGKERP